jgi:hypothetical protein
VSTDTAFASAPPSPPSAPRAQRSTNADLSIALIAIVILAVAGAVVGFIWQAWAPPGPAAQVLGGGKFIPDETEAFIAGDGRYLVLTAAVGLVAALAAYFLRPANRGVVLAAGLILGGFAGAVVTRLVGRLTGGGSATGHVVTVAGGQYRLSDHLPLSLHMTGLVVIEPAVAALVYGLLVAFAVHDDLGRPDPVRERVTMRRGGASEESVHAGGYPQDGGGYRDAASAPQQGDLPPQ